MRCICQKGSASSWTSRKGPLSALQTCPVLVPSDQAAAMLLSTCLRLCFVFPFFWRNMWTFQCCRGTSRLQNQTRESLSVYRKRDWPQWPKKVFVLGDILYIPVTVWLTYTDYPHIRTKDKGVCLHPHKYTYLCWYMCKLIHASKA